MGQGECTSADEGTILRWKFPGKKYRYETCKNPHIGYSTLARARAEALAEAERGPYLEKGTVLAYPLPSPLMLPEGFTVFRTRTRAEQAEHPNPIDGDYYILRSPAGYHTWDVTDAGTRTHVVFKSLSRALSCAQCRKEYVDNRFHCG